MKKSKARGRSAVGGSRKELSVSNVMDGGDTATVHGVEFLPGLFETKWQDILEQEERDLMILEIRDEIVKGSIDIAYANYLERQTISYAVHCSAMAWIKLLDWCFPLRDPGEKDLDSPSWSTDTEPRTLGQDTWAGKAVPVKLDEETESEEKEEEVEEEQSMFVSSGALDEFPMTVTESTTFSLNQRSEAKWSRVVSLGDMTVEGSRTDTTSMSTNRRRSTFTRVMTLPRDKLPKSAVEMMPTSVQPAVLSAANLEARMRRDLEEMVRLRATLEPVAVRVLPQERIDIKVNIHPAEGAGDAAGGKRKPPKTSAKTGLGRKDKKASMIRLN